MKTRNTSTNAAMPSKKGHDVRLVQAADHVDSQYVERTSFGDKIVVPSKDFKRLTVSYNVEAAGKRRANRTANSIAPAASSDK